MTERSTNQRAVPSPVKRTFSGVYILDYESVSAMPSKPYEQSAKLLIDLDGGVKDGEVVVEIGCGTGNSTIVFAESNPNFGRMICVEPSKDLLTLAKYKFGDRFAHLPNWGKIAEEPSDPEKSIEFEKKVNEAKGYIENQRERAARLNAKVDFVLGRSDGHLLPIASNVADRIYLSNVLHWLAFKDDGDLDRNYLEGAFEDFARVLKNGGKLLFNLSLQFDFGEETLNGRPLNSYQVVGHPFSTKFLANVRRVLKQNVENGDIDVDLIQTPYGEETIDYKKIDPTCQMVNWQFLESRLGSHGFEVIQYEDKPYKLALTPIPKQNVAQDILSAARMRCFNSPTLINLSDDVKNRIIENAFTITQTENGQLLEQESAQIIASFAFKLSK